MALWYTLMLSDVSVNKSLVEQVVSDMNFGRPESEVIKGGFQITELSNTCGFSVTYSSDIYPLFGYEDERLEKPFDYKTTITLRINRELEQDFVLENVAKFITLTLARMADDALLTLNGTVYLNRAGATYRVYPEGGIWDTPTGRAFLAETPHTLLA